MRNKKGFTIIELIVVIAILGIVVLLALPKFIGYNERAVDTSVNVDLKVVQTAVDVKTIDNGGELPYDIEIGDAKKLDISTLQPQYLKSITPRDGYVFWIDGFGKVSYNDINPPQNITYNQGSLSWNPVENAKGYNVYLLSEKREVSLLELIGIQTVYADSVSPELKKKLYTTTNNNSIELPEGTYLVSAFTDKKESVAVGENFKGGEITEGENSGDNGSSNGDESNNSGSSNTEEGGNSSSPNTPEKETSTPQKGSEDIFSINMNEQIKLNEDGTLSLLEGWAYEGTNPQILTENKELITGGTELGYYYYQLERKLKFATFELKVKSLLNNGGVSGGMNGSMFIRTGDTGVGYYFYPDRVDIYNDISEPPIHTVQLKGNEYHTYRIVKNDKIATLYIDGESIGEFTLKTNTGNNQYRFFFGDGISKTQLSEIYFKDIKIAPGELLYID